MIFFGFGSILMILGIFLIIYFEAARDDMISGMLIVFIGFIIIISTVLSGVATYPNLVRDRTEIVVLGEEIDAIKNTHYSNVESGVLVGGSLDNMKQGNKVYEYVSSYTRKKAKFNGVLESIKVRMSIPLYWWVQNTAFMDKRILELEKI